ncbi:MAG: hypothetical protein R3Y22_09135 [Bacteroidales bacterium]
MTLADKFLILVLALVFLDYGSYGYIFVVFLFPYFIRIQKKISINFIFLFLFGLLYITYAKFNGYEVSANVIIRFLLLYPMLYSIGYNIVKNKTQEQIVKIISLFAISIGLLALLSVYKSINEFGFVYIARSLPLIGVSTEYISATGLFSRLSLMVTFSAFIFLQQKKMVIFNLILTVIGIVAFIASLRLQSRTSIVLFILSYLLIFYLSWKDIKFTKKMALVVFSFIIIYLIAYFAIANQESLLILNRLEDSSELKTGGGRMQLLTGYINEMIDYPFGVPAELSKKSGYAHNIFIDCFKVAGVFPFILLVMLYCHNIYTVVKLYKIRYKFMDSFKAMLILFNLAILIVFFAEPVLEGISVIFAFFCFLLGFQKGVYQYKYVLPNKHTIRVL